MQIKINWQNINTSADGVRVYRSSSFIIPSALPAVYATIAGSATEYIDTSVIKDATYFYVFEVFKGTDSAFSTNVQATAVTYSGPGPQLPIVGDLDLGYYGIVQSSELISWDAFIAWCGVTLLTKTTTTSQDWIKFAYKGKTLYTPRQPLGTISWQTLYNAGLVYGVDGMGPREYNTLTAVNQQRIITAANNQFKVRLPTALPPGADLTKDYSTVANTATIAAGGTGVYTFDSYDTNYDLTGSEWNDLIYKVLSWSPAGQRGENFVALDATIAFNGAIAGTGLNGDNLHQELLPNLNTVNRGLAQSATYTWHPGRTSTSLWTTTTRYWRPILEMV